jgi:hypothetical protein
MSHKTSRTWYDNALLSSTIATPIIEVVKTVMACTRALIVGISFFWRYVLLQLVFFWKGGAQNLPYITSDRAMTNTLAS